MAGERRSWIAARIAATTLLASACASSGTTPHVSQLPGPKADFAVVGHGFVALQVRHVGEAAEWYATTFGLQQLMQFDDPRGRFAIRLLSRDGMTVELIEQAGTTEPQGSGVFGLFKAGVYVADIDAVHAWMVEQGVDVDERVFTDEKMRARSFLLRDLEGNRLQIFQRHP